MSTTDSVTGDSVLKPVAVIAASFYWRAMIRDILPTGSRGMIIVFKNPCTEPFTYQIDGPIVKYLGVGDHHDEQFENMEKASEQTDLEAFSKEQAVYSGVNVDAEVCPFSFHIFPSDHMKAEFTSYDPIIVLVSVVSIFVFTSLVFLCYDRIVEQRQRTVLKTAVDSSANVSSLFPAAVREQMFPSETKSMLDDNHEAEKLVGSPIAQLYTDSTVFFADISGFTEWSSSRQPTEVFQLLETLYAGFDAIAKRRRIFKVETIGDSYVAVVGLPTPRQHHAVVMARFAADCRDTMTQVTTKLAKSLGTVCIDE